MVALGDLLVPGHRSREHAVDECGLGLLLVETLAELAADRVLGSVAAHIDRLVGARMGVQRRGVVTLQRTSSAPFPDWSALWHEGRNRQFAKLGHHRGVGALRLLRDRYGILPRSITLLLRRVPVRLAHHSAMLLALLADDLVFQALGNPSSLLFRLFPSIELHHLLRLGLPGSLLILQILGYCFDVTAATACWTPLGARFDFVDVGDQVHALEAPVVLLVMRWPSL